MGKQWNLEHRDLMLEYCRKYRNNHPEYVDKEKKRMAKAYMFRKEWQRLLNISLTPLE
jgi:hypothetical protein